MRRPYKHTVLIVDDELPMKRLFESKFRKQVKAQEMQLLFAYDGREALAILNEQPGINIIFTDINMPGMDGLTLLKQLKSHFQGCAIIITAYGDQEHIRAAMNEGAFDFLFKPLNFNDLESTLNRAIETQMRNVALERRSARLERDLADARARITELERTLAHSLISGEC